MTLSVNPASRVFCNRSLNMANIAAVGFDMDYTLAMYKPETFEVLAYESACKKLVEVYGYPEEITAFRYDHAYMVRGLVVDKKRGNILKMDRHKYVKVAHHGFQELDADTRLKTYCDTAKVDQFDGGNYANVDTLFALGETYLFCQLVELRDAMKETDPSHPFTAKAFDEIYDEIRASVDLCHRDGTLKRAVANDPAAFIHADDALVPMLQSLKASGKKVFLLTNSLWDFTNVVMNYLCNGTVGEDKSAEWLDLFDVVVTGSCKPGFFENERAAIFEVDRVTRCASFCAALVPRVPRGERRSLRTFPAARSVSLVCATRDSRPRHHATDQSRPFLPTPLPIISQRFKKHGRRRADAAHRRLRGGRRRGRLPSRAQERLREAAQDVSGRVVPASARDVGNNGREPGVIRRRSHLRGHLTE